MKIRPTEKSFKARALTDAQPSFVSLVRAGANQRPFKVVKMDPDAIEPQENDMTEETQKSEQEAALAVGNGYGIVAIRFSGEDFDSETKVKAWLDEGGYVDYEITSKDDGFEVNSGLDFELGSVRRTDPRTGLQVFVGKLTSPIEVEKSNDEQTDEHAAVNTSSVTTEATIKSDDADEDGQAVEKADENADEGAQEAAEKTVHDEDEDEEERTADKKKADDADPSQEAILRFDDFDAFFSDEPSLAAVLAAGDDGFPGGLYELTTAMYYAVRNAIRAGQADQISTIAADYGRRVEMLAMAFDGMDEAQRAEFEAIVLGNETMVEKEDEGTETSVIEKAEEAGDDAAEDVEKEDAGEEDGVVEKTEDGADDAEASTETVVEKSEEADEADAEDAPEETAKGDGDVVSAVKSLLSEGLAGVVEKIDEIGERVTNLEDRGQTRKGADASDEAAAPTGDATSRRTASRIKSALGVQSVSNPYEDERSRG